MLDWMTMDPNLRQNGYHLEGYHLSGAYAHPLYTYVFGDKIYWIKHDNQKIWDVNRIVNGKIYWWITEMDKLPGHTESYDWGTADGRDYKESLGNNGLGFWAMNRCTTPGPGSEVAFPNADYARKVDCNTSQTQPLKHAKFWVNGPMNIAAGGDLGTISVLKLTYMYNCNTAIGSGPGAAVSDCETYEAFYFSKTYGLVRWELYKGPAGGPFNLDSRTTFNQIVAFGPLANPIHPCF
jgi:hypothetical protein